MQEAIAQALAAYVGLVQSRKTDRAFPTVLARYAVGHVRDGRRVGSAMNSRDVLSISAQRKRRFTVKSLDRLDAGESRWQQAVLDDWRTPVPDQVAFRIDFAMWLLILPRRDRQIAENLAIGRTTSEVARQFNVSPARISQKRQELQTSWTTFLGEAVSEF